MGRTGKWKLLVMIFALTLILTGCASAPASPPPVGSVPTATAETAAPEPALDAAPDVSGQRPVRSVTTTITLADDAIAIKGPGARTQGSTLTITADGVYELSGTLSKGQVIVDASDAAQVELVLSGVDITAGENAAIYCKNADNLIITLTDGTRNTLTDSSAFSYADMVNEEPNAALFSKCDLNIGGKGWLMVNASFRHGICSKDDLVIEGGGFMVNAAMDAIRATDSITAKDGNFNLTAGGDGFQASKADDPAKGWALFEGGSYVIRACSDGVQAETELTIKDGNFDIVTEGTPAGESNSQKGLKAANSLTVENGNFCIISRDDAVHADVDALINGGTFYIETGDDGIHANRKLYINGGEIRIPVCYEGFEGTIITMNGGTAFIDASNDAVSAAAGTPEADTFSGRGGNPNVQAWFNGGELEAVAGGDVVDSNGNIYVTGGTLRLSAPPWPDYEGSLLCNGDVTITGGTIASVGCMGVNVYWDEQPILWVSHANELPCGTVLCLRDAEEKPIVELTTLEDAVQSVFTSPKLEAGETYALYVDDERKLEVTLNAGMNAIGDDGGRFTGGYSRGNMAEYR